MHAIIYEYEDVLLGKKSMIPPDYFNSTEENNQQLAIMVLRHMFEQYLRWSPENVKELISWDLLKKMKVVGLISYLRFPPEINPQTDLFYIAQILYPDEIHYNFKKMCINTYKKILMNDKEKLPKGFLMESTGCLRGIICLQYILDNEMTFDNVDEMYQHFASANGTKTLKKYRLSGMCNDFFETPLDFLHHSLPKKQRNQFLYCYYKLQSVMKRVTKS